MSTTTSLVSNNFGGIRKKETLFSEGKITCSDCQNVELFFTGLNSGVGIRTANGNKSVSRYVSDETVVELIPDGENVVGIFEALQDGSKYFVIYAESSDEGKLYSLNLTAHTITTIVSGLTVTGKACATNFMQGWLDMFIFSNGIDTKYIYSDTNLHTSFNIEADSIEENSSLYSIEGDVVTEESTDAFGKYGKITATIDSHMRTLYRKKTNDTSVNGTNYYAWISENEIYYTTSDVKVIMYDTEGRDIKGLGLVVFDSRLWIFDGKSLWYSQQGECRDFSFQDASLVTSAGYIDFAKNITAIHEYLGSLAVFHNDSSVLVMLDGATGFKCDEESPGGCASYNSLVFHGTDLYFYDDTKKGIFSFKQIVNGDKTLGDNIAYDIQEELLKIEKSDLDKIQTLSVVTSDRNEVWFLTPIYSTYKKKVETTNIDVEASIILIFDYIRGEWIKRKCKKISSIGIVNSTIYSAGSSIYEEYVGENFDNDFIEAYYTCSAFNCGSDNTLKITKFPPRTTVDGGKKCNFWVRYIRNYSSSERDKTKELKGKTTASIGYYDRGYYYDSGAIYSASTNVIVKLPSSTFKALEIHFYTKNKSQSFAIKALEFSKLKVKQI